MKEKRSHHKKVPKRSHHKKIVKVIAPIKEPILFVPEKFEIEEPIILIPSYIHEDEVIEKFKEDPTWWSKFKKWIV